MGILITSDNPYATFELSAFGEQHPSTIQFINSQYANIGEVTDQAAKAFLNTTLDICNRINGSDAVRAAKAAVGRVRNMFQSDTIRILNELHQMQHAGLQMQRWIMANPTVRSLYHKQGCDGYSDTYVDVEPGTVGDFHYDYQIANDGLTKFIDDEGNWEATTYDIDLKEGDRFLDHIEQLDIQATWTSLEAEILHGRFDPTSKHNYDL